MKKQLTAIWEYCIKTKNKLMGAIKLKHIVTLLVAAFVVVCSLGIAVFTVSLSIKASVRDLVITNDEAADLSDVDMILVLGAGLRSDGSPSDMLADRLRVGVSLWKDGVCDTMLMSGDNSGEYYNEVAAMREFAIDCGIPSEAIVLDGEGFSTYESIFRAINEFGAKKIIIVTQEYHLYRAIYVAKALGIEVYGVSADLNTYRAQIYRDIREHLARFKDFLLTIERD